MLLLTTVIASNSKIRGRITNSKTGEPLIGANIMLDDTMLGNASDENGHYIIKDIPIGNYTLLAMFIGYETHKKDLWIEANQLYTINISLKSSAIELQETLVTSEKRKGKVTFL